MRSMMFGSNFMGQEVRVWFPGPEDQFINGKIASYDETGILMEYDSQNGTEILFVPFASILYIGRPKG